MPRERSVAGSTGGRSKVGRAAYTAATEQAYPKALRVAVGEDAAVPEDIFVTS
jgi:hypothetical protein